MIIIKYQLSIHWLFVSKSNVKKSGNLRGRQLLNLSSIELPSKKSNHIRKDDLTDFDFLIAQVACVKSGICAVVYPFLMVLLPQSTNSACK